MLGKQTGFPPGVEADLLGNPSGIDKIVGPEGQSPQPAALQSGGVHQLVGEQAQVLVVRGRRHQAPGLLPCGVAREPQGQGEAARPSTHRRNRRRGRGAFLDEELDLDGFEPVPEVQGLADTWWRGKDSLIAVYRGEASGFDAPHCLRAHIYGGLDAWGLGGT